MKTTANAISLLKGVIEPLGRCLSPESAREILALQADSAAVRRLEELARGCDTGQLTPEERAEYQLLAEVGDLVGLLQAKARHYLGSQPGA